MVGRKTLDRNSSEAALLVICRTRRDDLLAVIGHSEWQDQARFDGFLPRITAVSSSPMVDISHPSQKNLAHSVINLTDI
jgi:hypothetical protein